MADLKGRCFGSALSVLGIARFPRLLRSPRATEPLAVTQLEIPIEFDQRSLE